MTGAPKYINAEVVCGGKHPFPTRALALDVAGRHKRKRKKLSAYRCAVCSHWHVGNKSRLDARRRASLRLKREIE